MMVSFNQDQNAWFCEHGLAAEEEEKMFRMSLFTFSHVTINRKKSSAQRVEDQERIRRLYDEMMNKRLEYSRFF
ncbi:YrzI family small protein [Sporolactobacillus sp. THM7-4]|nr:YrzI family small protein [Sporolactobacillus sp. THM7-4]